MSYLIGLGYAKECESRLVNTQVQQYKQKLNEYKNNLAKYEKEYNDYLASIQGKIPLNLKLFGRIYS